MNDLKNFTSHSEEETLTYGERLAENLSAGDVIALQGGLGAGKTRLVKGIAQGFGIDASRVTSPTFSLLQEYNGTLPVYHFDFYRLETVREAIEIGAEEYFYGLGVCLIEWPERIASILPEQLIWIEIKNRGASQRQFIMKQKSS